MARGVGKKSRPIAQRAGAPRAGWASERGTALGGGRRPRPRPAEAGAVPMDSGKAPRGWDGRGLAAVACGAPAARRSTAGTGRQPHAQAHQPATPPRARRCNRIPAAAALGRRHAVGRPLLRQRRGQAAERRRRPLAASVASSSVSRASAGGTARGRPFAAGGGTGGQERRSRQAAGSRRPVEAAAQAREVVEASGGMGWQRGRRLWRWSTKSSADPSRGYGVVTRAGRRTAAFLHEMRDGTAPQRRATTPGRGFAGATLQVKGARHARREIAGARARPVEQIARSCREALEPCVSFCSG